MDVLGMVESVDRRCSDVTVPEKCREKLARWLLRGRVRGEDRQAEELPASLRGGIFALFLMQIRRVVSFQYANLSSPRLKPLH